MSPPRKVRWILVALLIGVGAWFAYVHRESLDRESLLNAARAMPPAGFVIAFLLLPLLGAPISIFLIAAGMRFGLAGGVLVTAGCIVCHHFAAYWISHHGPRERFQAWLKRKGYGIPAMEGTSPIRWTAVFAAVSGPPYAVKLYLLALTDVPFRIYLGVGAPIYLLLGTGIIAGGAAVGRFNVLWVSPVVALIAISVFIGRKLRKSAAVPAIEPKPRKP